MFYPQGDTASEVLETLEIDYAHENLLLFYQTDGAIGGTFTFHDPVTEGNGSIIEIEHATYGQLAALQTHLFAYRVHKSISRVTIILDGLVYPIPMQSTIICPQTYEPVCADRMALEDPSCPEGCSVRFQTFDNLCALGNDVRSVYLYDGECEQDLDRRTLADVSAIVRSNEQFGYRLMQAYLDPETNLFVSPFSILAALTMTYGGMYGDTAANFETFFGFEDNLSVHNAFAATFKAIRAEHNDFRIANSIWPHAKMEGYLFYPGYLAMVPSRYDAVVELLDYNDATVYKTINQWVESKTEAKIKDLIPAPLPADTQMVLVNAIYFNGAWAMEFDENETAEALFDKADGSSVTTDMMYMVTDVNYTETALYQAVDLAYAAREFSMVVLLPRSGVTLDAVLDDVAERSLQQVVGAMETTGIELYLPKFTIKWGTEDLRDPLMAMGLELPFPNPESDFSLMATVIPGTLAITKVLHQTFVEVSEAGTEAAAATAVVVSEIAGVGPEIPVVRADHPFLFFIRDNRTGLILFAGVLADPAS